MTNGPRAVSPKAITFDFYGTLMQTRSHATEAFERILQWNECQDLSVEDFYKAWLLNSQKFHVGPYRRYRELCAEALEQTFADYGRSGRGSDIEHYFDGFASLEPWPDVVEVLGQLAERYPLAIVTNCDRDLFEATPKPPVPFRYRFTAEDARGYKSDGTLFRFALREMGVTPSETLQVGQSQRTDLVGAKPLGIMCAWINRHSLKLDPDVPAPDWEFVDLRPLTDLLA